jgi:PKD repeat protein
MVLMLIILPFVTINRLDHQSVYNRIRAQFFIFTINLYPLLEIINHFGRPSLDHQFNWLVFIPSVLIAITAVELLSCSITSAFAPAVSTFLFFLYGATLQLIIFGSNSYIYNEPNAWYWASLLSFLTISIPFLKCFWPRNVKQNGGAIKTDWPPLEKTSHLFFRITIFLFLLMELINQYWVTNQDYQTSWTLLLFVILSWPLSSYFRTEIPSAHFTSSQSVGEGKVVSFAGTESYRISSYSWDYGDGIQRTNQKPNSKHTYKDAGTYRVSLTISGDIGADTCTKQLKVTKVKRKAKKHIPIHKFLPMNFLVEPCMRCLETEMSLLKISPNGNSIQYQCTNCNKKKHAAALSPEAKKRAVSHFNSKNNDQIIFSTNDAPLPYEQTTRSPIPESVRSEVWRRDMGKCVQCESNQNLQFDHIIPFSKGGSNSARNLQLLCQRCNASKSNKI